MSGIFGVPEAEKAGEDAPWKHISYRKMRYKTNLHLKEQALWHAHALLPKGAKWYQEKKRDMASALKQANKLKGYTLVDRATWLANKNQLDLVELRAGDRGLVDLYSIVLRNSDRQIVNVVDSSNFLEWFNSEEGIHTLKAFKINNEPVFSPIRKD